MRWWTLVGVVALGACEGRPDREPLDSYASSADSDWPEIRPNSCVDVSHAFEARFSGYLSEDLEGYASYDYRQPEGRTNIVFRACDPQQAPVAMTLVFWGTDRVGRGTHDVSMDAEEVGGFEFGFHDERGGSEIRCSDRPVGTVTIEKATVARVVGTFDIEAGCIDDQVIVDNTRPPRARFVGSFEADNEGAL